MSLSFASDMIERDFDLLKNPAIGVVNLFQSSTIKKVGESYFVDGIEKTSKEVFDLLFEYYISD